MTDSSMQYQVVEPEMNNEKEQIIRLKHDKLQIVMTRTCECPPNHINCLTPKEWMKSQLGVWQFNYEGRDIRDKKSILRHIPLLLPENVLNCFPIKGS